LLKLVGGFEQNEIRNDVLLSPIVFTFNFYGDIQKKLLGGHTRFGVIAAAPAAFTRSLAHSILPQKDPPSLIAHPVGITKMKFTSVALLFVVFGCAVAEEFFDDQTSLDDAGQARFLYFNSSSTATSLTLLGAIILLGVIAYLVYAGGLLGSNAYNRNGYEQNYYDQPYDHQQYNSQYR
jgi:hypothetical protein